MPIPVPIPPGALAITDADSARAEALVAAIAQIIQYGTTGATVNTPGTTVPSGPNQALVPVVLSTPEQQLYQRQVAVAMAKSLIALASAATLGITKLSSDPTILSNPVALSAEEVTDTPGANKVPRARSDGTLDPVWLTGGPGGGGGLVPTFNATCASSDVVGDLVRVTAPLKVVSRVSITDVLTMPAIGVIIQKPSSTSAVVQCTGLIQGVYTGLTPGGMYFVGSNGRPTISVPTPGVGTSVFLQLIGVAVDADVLLLAPNLMLSELPG